MPFYADLKDLEPAERVRAAQGLLKLKEKLAAEVPARSVRSNLLLATWNIREFDSEKYGDRSAESYHYIAEIIDHFDLVTVQEVREDLSALLRVKALLGSWWEFLVTDVTEGTSGNGERIAFLYDTRKIRLSGLSGEVVLPQPRGKKEPLLQFARTPFICGFKCGWTRFNLCSVHIYYGKSQPLDPRRLKELEDMGAFFAQRAKKEAQLAKRNGGVAPALILLGDFNIFKNGDATLKALTDHGFKVAPGLEERGAGSNLGRDKYYDQILIQDAVRTLRFTGKGGTFDWSQCVFGKDQEETYKDLLKKSKGAKGNVPKYNDWRTYQMSDHLVLWTELQTDFSTGYLEFLSKEKQA